MAEEKRLIIIILLMAAVTYVPRVLPLRIDQKYWPKWIKTSLEFLPVAIVASITIPNVLINSYTSRLLNSELLTTILAIVVAYYSKNLIVTVLSSLVFFFIAENYLFMN